MPTFQHAAVRGLRMFYREAGSKTFPTIVLLHGFPSSSHMFRDLIPKLADKFYLIAPDHTPLLTAPDKVVDIILEAATATCN